MSKYLITVLCLAMCFALLIGCTGRTASHSHAGKLWPEPDPEKMIVSNGGSYGIQYRVLSDRGGIPTNDVFHLWVFPFVQAEDEWVSAQGVGLKVDAAMPHHGHGMNVVPKVIETRRMFNVEGMLFHMPGRWELYFDITRDGVTERAQTEVFLE